MIVALEFLFTGIIIGYHSGFHFGVKRMKDAIESLSKNDK